MDILIVDDEPLARARLQKMLENIEDCSVVGEASNGNDALSEIERLDPDLILLDIRMPGKDGMAVANQIQQLEDPPAIIFCSAYDQYALEAFDVKAVGYLLKPVRAEQLREALDNAKRLNRLQRQRHNPTSEKVPSRQHIAAKTHRGVELIEIDTIRFFSADQKYVTVVHTGGTTLIDDTLKELETMFAGSFIRIHRNALVSIKHIVALERNLDKSYQLLLADCDVKPVVSRRHLAAVKELMQQL